MTIAYVVAAAACIAALQAGRRPIDPGSSPRWLWLGLGVLCGVLGLNKQLDLHRTAVDAFRSAAQHLGLIEHRREMQLLAAVAATAAVVLAVCAAAWRLRHARAAAQLALFAVVVLLSAAVLRATTLLHVGDRLPVLRSVPAAALLFMELTGAVLAIVAATRSRRR